MILDRSANSGGAQIIAILDASRNERNCLRSEFAKCARHDRCRTNSVDVVVAVNQYDFAVIARSRESLDRFGKAAHRETVVEMRQSRAEEIFCLLSIDMSADEKKIRDSFRNAQGRLQTCDGFMVRNARNYPACI